MATDRGVWFLFGCLGLAFLAMVASVVIWFLASGSVSTESAPVAFATADPVALPPVAVPLPPPVAPPPVPEPPVLPTDPLAPMTVTPSPPASPSGQGELDPSVVRGVVAREMPDIRRCYDQLLARRPTAGGRIVVDFRIATTGAVDSAEVSSDGIGDAAMARCVTSAVRGWRFPAPSGGPVTVSFPFQLQSAGGETTGSDAPPPPAGDVPETPDRSAIQNAMRALTPAMRDCAGDLRGAAIVRVTFVSSGRGSTAEIVGTFAGTPAATCMTTAARGMTVPPFRSASTTVTYPFSIRD